MIASPQNPVLSKVQNMLHDALEKIIQSLARLDKETAESTAGPSSRPQQHLQGLERRLQAAQAVAGRDDVTFAEGEKAIRAYMSGAEALRHRLAQWAGRAIG